MTKDELQIREHQYHVERVAELVPYWIKCVDAAANGEDMRLEPFLNSLRDVSDSWMTSIANPWGPGPGTWDERGDEKRWGVHPDARSMASSQSGNGSRSRTGSPSITSDAPTGYAFVENIARQGSVTDADRKRRMHMFFAVGLNQTALFPF